MASRSERYTARLTTAEVHASLRGYAVHWASCRLWCVRTLRSARQTHFVDEAQTPDADASRPCEVGFNAAARPVPPQTVPDAHARTTTDRSQACRARRRGEVNQTRAAFGRARLRSTRASGARPTVLSRASRS